MIFSPTEEAARSKLQEWAADPVAFVRQQFKAEPDAWQHDVLENVPGNQRIALKACVGPGKTCLLAWVVWWFISTRFNARIACTSITAPNLKDGLWAELAKWQARSPFLIREFKWSAQSITNRDRPGTWWASARTWNRDADPDVQGATLQGLHEEHSMAVIDEAGGIPDSVMASAEGVLSSGGDLKILIAGNPTHLTGPLYRACKKERKFWFVKEINGDPDNPDRAPRVRVDWAAEMIEKYGGREASFVRARVLGKFPRRASTSLIGLGDFEDAYGRLMDPKGVALERGLKVLGVDIAREGDDRSVIVQRDGAFLDGVREYREPDTFKMANIIHEIAMGWEAKSVRVDDIGVGGGVVDNLRNKVKQYQLVPVNVGRKSEKVDNRGHPLYRNLRAEINMRMREYWFGKGQISIEPDVQKTSIETEGTDIRFKAEGKFQIELKAEYKKRHNGESPDVWDAVVLAFMEDGAAKTEANTKGKLQPDLVKIYGAESVRRMGNVVSNILEEQF